MPSPFGTAAKKFTMRILSSIPFFIARSQEKIIKKSSLFDVDYYIWKNKVELGKSTSAIQHYLSVGWKMAFDTHPLFKTPYYLNHVGDINEPALIHYITTGSSMGISPHPLFDIEYYYKQRPDVKAERAEPISHYLEYGSRENTNPSEFFHEEYYKSKYPYVAASGMNSLVHFVLHGDREYLNPSRSFSTKQYALANPDVAASSIGILEHYVLHGKQENRPLRPQHNMHTKTSSLASVSVVIPTFNRASLLRETIKHCQIYSDGLDIEFIIINDGSSDDTAGVLSELSTTYENLTYRSIANSGPGVARNLGASIATKDVILFLGDDIQPLNDEFFRTHARLHATYLSQRFAVLGKCVWPQDNSFDVNHVMRHIQGRAGEQFGYADLAPHTFISWPFFYTANISVKRNLIADWIERGFSPKFNLYGFEDAEFAFRLSQEPGGFKIYYDPTSVGQHIHHYNVDGFLRRQFNTGVMANVFVSLHDVAEQVNVKTILHRLNMESRANDSAIVSDCLSILDGVKAWTRLLDREGGLGREAWHDDLLAAVFEATYYQGFIAAQMRMDANLASAYQFVLGNFISRMRRVIHHEVTPHEFIQSALFDPLISR